MSTRTWPSPAQVSQRPPGTLKEKSLAVRPRARASSRGREQLADPVEGLQVGDGVGARRAPDRATGPRRRPRRRTDAPSIASWAPTGRSQRPWRCRSAAQMTSVHERRLAGAGDAGHAGERARAGSRTSMPLRLWARAPRTLRARPFPLRRLAGTGDLQLAAQVLGGEAAAVVAAARVRSPGRRRARPAPPLPGRGR